MLIDQPTVILIFHVLSVTLIDFKCKLSCQIYTVKTIKNKSHQMILLKQTAASGFRFNLILNQAVKACMCGERVC